MSWLVGGGLSFCPNGTERYWRFERFDFAGQVRIPGRFGSSWSGLASAWRFIRFDFFCSDLGASVLQIALGHCCSRFQVRRSDVVFHTSVGGAQGQVEHCCVRAEVWTV